MKCNSRLLVFGLLMVLGAPLAGDPGFPDRLVFADKSYLRANTSSVKVFGFIKVLTACLYLGEGHAVADYPGRVPLALRLHYQRNFSKEQLIASADKVLNELYAKEELEEIEGDLKAISSAYVDVEKGDEYTLVYHPSRGTSLLFNGVETIVISGDRFAEIYFAIWLGDHPDVQKLSRELLKQP